MDIIIVVILAVALIWMGKVFYLLQRGFNELMTAMNSLDERLQKIENNTRRS